MFQRKTSGSVVCPSCGSLVGVRDDRCYTCGRANPGLWGFGPLLRQWGADFGFVPIVIGGSSILYALSLLVTLTSGEDIGKNLGVNFLAPSGNALMLFGMSGTIPVFGRGYWWTLLTASWLHGNFLHLLFNMMWVRQLATTTADILGPSRTVIVYTVAGVCGFLLSSVAGLTFAYTGLSIPLLQPAFNTVGASASIFGLLGALVHYGRKGGSSYIHAEAKQYAILLFVFGVIMQGVDNYAHAGGFLGGYAASALMNPWTQERGDHLLAAMACLLATLLALVYSVLRVAPLLAARP